MLESLFTLGRLIVVMTFVLLMPVLAIPSILDRIDQWLHGEQSGIAVPSLDLWIRQSLAYFAGHQGKTEQVDAEFYELLEVADVRDKADQVRKTSDFPRATDTYAARHGEDGTVRNLSDELQSAKAGALFEPAHVSKATFRQSLTNTIPSLSESVRQGHGVDWLDRVRQLQRKLEKLGARYMLLEQIDSNPVRFRCTCDVRMSESAAYTRRFQAERSTPLEAVEAVLQDVQQWHSASRRQPTSHR